MLKLAVVMVTALPTGQQLWAALFKLGDASQIAKAVEQIMMQVTAFFLLAWVYSAELEIGWFSSLACLIVLTGLAPVHAKSCGFFRISKFQFRKVISALEIQTQKHLGTVTTRFYIVEMF